eukprot:g3635.t1
MGFLVRARCREGEGMAGSTSMHNRQLSLAERFSLEHYREEDGEAEVQRRRSPVPAKDWVLLLTAFTKAHVRDPELLQEFRDAVFLPSIHAVDGGRGAISRLSTSDRPPDEAGTRANLDVDPQMGKLQRFLKRSRTSRESEADRDRQNQAQGRRTAAVDHDWTLRDLTVVGSYYSLYAPDDREVFDAIDRKLEEITAGGGSSHRVKPQADEAQELPLSTSYLSSLCRAYARAGYLSSSCSSGSSCLERLLRTELTAPRLEGCNAADLSHFCWFFTKQAHPHQTGDSSVLTVCQTLRQRLAEQCRLRFLSQAESEQRFSADQLGNVVLFCAAHRFYWQEVVSPGLKLLPKLAGVGGGASTNKGRSTVVATETLLKFVAAAGKIQYAWLGFWHFVARVVLGRLDALAVDEMVAVVKSYTKCQIRAAAVLRALFLGVTQKGAGVLSFYDVMAVLQAARKLAVPLPRRVVAGLAQISSFGSAEKNALAREALRKASAERGRMEDGSDFDFATAAGRGSNIANT